MLCPVVPVDMPAVNMVQGYSTLICQEREKWPIRNCDSFIQQCETHIKRAVCVVR